ncbi:hypothetical protein PSEUDO8AS_100232 [Pseudomonas sp. 8AS]|nr:hypothetical protein PSEUDO8AS_100232 [Pseudomonas sp. 8AS]
MWGAGGVQKQESPHRAGFTGVFPVMWEHVETCIWWSRGDLNPRPPVRRYRFYMRSHLY